MTMGGRDRTTTRWLAAISMVLVLAACSGGAGQPSATPATAVIPSPTLASTPSLAPTPTAAPTLVAASATAPALEAGITPLDAGTHAAHVMGTGTYPGYTVVVPGGWFDRGGHFVIKYPTIDVPAPVLGVSVWDVGKVFRDPCHWTGQAADPGPGVANLVRALVAQPMRNATKPTDVTLAGYKGRYLEWSVPADMKSSTWTDFDACDVEPSDGHHNFMSFLGNGDGDRWEQVPGQVDRLWVLDVHGQRLLVDATYSPDTTQADRDEEGKIVQSLRFVAP